MSDAFWFDLEVCAECLYSVEYGVSADDLLRSPTASVRAEFLANNRVENVHEGDASFSWDSCDMCNDERGGLRYRVSAQWGEVA